MRRPHDFASKTFDRTRAAGVYYFGCEFRYAG